MAKRTELKDMNLQALLKLLNKYLKKGKTEEVEEIIRVIRENQENYEEVSQEFLEEKKEEALRNGNTALYDYYKNLKKEKEQYEKSKDIIDEVCSEDYELPKKFNFNKRSFKKAAITGGIILLAVAGTGLFWFFKSRKPVNTGDNGNSGTEAPKDPTGEFDDEEKILIEEAASEYYADYADFFTKNDETNQITEQDVINLAYLINDREDLLTKEALEDAFESMDMNLGYEPSALISIVSQVANIEENKKNGIKEGTKELEKLLKKNVKDFIPSKLSRLVVKNSDELSNIIAMEDCTEDVVNSIKENGKVSKKALENYNNLLVKLHYDRAYDNLMSVSDNTENNDNFGFKHLAAHSAYSFFDTGISLNQYSETAKSTEIKDPLTGEKAFVYLYPQDNESREVTTRKTNRESSKKLNKEYTKIRNKYPIYNYEDTMCNLRERIRELVKNNSNSLKLTK